MHFVSVPDRSQLISLVYLVDGKTSTTGCVFLYGERFLEDVGKGLLSFSFVFFTDHASGSRVKYYTLRVLRYFSVNNRYVFVIKTHYRRGGRRRSGVLLFVLKVFGLGSPPSS